MKVRFYCDSGANIHSQRSKVVDLEAEFGIDETEWVGMTDDDQHEFAMEWAWNNGLNVGWEPVND